MTHLNVITLLIPALVSSAALANDGERIISQVDSVVQVNLNKSTVKCSIKGYGSEELKVLVPALAELTIMDHRNPGEAAPCITAGPCTDTKRPEAILDPNRPAENIPVRVTLSKTLFLDQKAQKCSVILNESVESKIRGLSFNHRRSAVIGERNPDDCR